MGFRPFSSRKISPGYLGIFSVVVLAAAALAVVNCGNTRFEFVSNPPTGTVSVSISDPPSCAVPNGPFEHVYISIRSVQAHISSNADDHSPGWQELAPQLVSQPVQVDLLGSVKNGCVLAQLGSNSSLPVGDYQQIRLLLVSNSPAPGTPLPASIPNPCGTEGFNCAVLNDGSIRELELSSQANTGLKIPPGQIMGGPIRVESGKHVDINIDFNACASIVQQGNGKMRLKPVLTAGQVSSNTTGISGQVVDRSTMQPVDGGTVLVALEQVRDGTAIDRIFMQAAADANGNFNFCPLPAGMYDVVAVALNKNGLAYNATVVLNVPAGPAVGGAGRTLGKIPVVAETGAATGPGTIQGIVTASSGNPPTTTGATVDVTVSALQSVPLTGGSSRPITIPLRADSTPNVTAVSNPPGITCPATGGAGPANTNCAQYTLVVPASNPSFGTFSASGTTFSMPATGDVLYTIEAQASAPTGGAPICSPSRQTTDKDSNGQPLKVIAGKTVNAQRLDFTGCS